MNTILDEVIDRHGEYMEHIGADDQPQLMISILCQMVQKEREQVKYLKERLRYAERNR